MSASSVTFNEAVQSSTIQFTLTGPGGTSVPGTVSYDSLDRYRALFIRRLRRGLAAVD